MFDRKSTILALLLVAVALVVGFQAAAPRGQEQPPPRDGVFIHITKSAEDPHAALMALQMADLMAADHDVLVYCDLRGINLLLRDAPELTFDAYQSSKALLESLVDKKVPIYACPSCLKAAGKSPDDLLRGVKPAEKDAFFNFTRGRILALDY